VREGILMTAHELFGLGVPTSVVFLLVGVIQST
jgi:hypothetical protein